MADILTDSELNSLIGNGTVFVGNIQVINSIRIDGKVVGNVSSTGTVTVGKKGMIEGNVSSKSTIVGGNVRGDILSLSKIILESTSVVKGVMKTRKLKVDEGAVFEGESIMSEKLEITPEVKQENKENKESEKKRQ